MKAQNQVCRKWQLSFSAMLMVAVLFASVAPLADANPSNCYSIQDRDRKNLCLATAKSQKSYCYSIGDSDSKKFCLAQVGGQRSQCYSIRAQDTRSHCLALVR